MGVRNKMEKEIEEVVEEELVYCHNCESSYKKGEHSQDMCEYLNR